VKVDVTRQAEVKALVQKAIDTYGKIDVLINNAGIMPIARLLSSRSWDRMIDLNIKGVLYGIAAALPEMQNQKSGHIINIASVFGIKVFAPGGTVLLRHQSCCPYPDRRPAHGNPCRQDSVHDHLSGCG
jgi:NADP-dependent 3-hydroxy acid dehydrogenase YdfG